MARGADRIELLDALRGVALLGILLANIPAFEGWAWISQDARIARTGATAELVDDVFRTVLLEGKFYTIFSLLFGIGITLQYRSFAARSADPGALIARRLIVLLLIGLAHFLFIWMGDILALYALVGFALIPAQSWPDRRLLHVAVLLIFAPVALAAVIQAAGLPGDLGMYGIAESAAAAFGRPFGPGVDPVAILASHRPADRLAWQAAGFFLRLGDFLTEWRPLKVLGIMLIGVWVARRLIEGRLPGDRALLRRVALIGIGLGLPLNFAYAATDGMYAADKAEALRGFALYAVAVVPLGLGYAAAFALAWPAIARRMGGLAAVGRMALTSYLTHSVAGMLIFSGFGLGLAGTAPPPWLYLLALAIYAAQILFARRWLARHDQGPVEALWRRLAFGGRRAGAAAA